MQTAKELGFIMPAEWENHSAVWLVWPIDETTFLNRFDKVKEKVAQIVMAFNGSEKVELLVANEDIKKEAEEILKRVGADLSNINFHIVKYADVWIRDYGPIFIVNRETKKLAMVDFRYDAYGKSDDPYFAPLLIDDKIPVWINESLGLQRFEPGIVLEGGAVDVNGEGMCLANEQCVLDEKRNPGITKEKMEKILEEYLGVKKIIWLKQGLTNDHTDGHIDEIARFINKNTIVCAFEDNIEDENYHILLENFQKLSEARDLDGKLFNIIKLPMPHMLYEEEEVIKQDGEKAPVSYCNFYIGNSVIVAAVFNDQNDKKALDILRKIFPDKKIVGINCRDVIYGGGAIHCMSQQMPSI